MRQRGVGREQRGVVDDPVRDPVAGPGHGQVAEPAPVLHPAQQHGRPVHDRRAGVHHRVDRIGPAVGGEQRVAGVAAEKPSLTALEEGGIYPNVVVDHARGAESALRDLPATCPVQLRRRATTASAAAAGPSTRNPVTPSSITSGIDPRG